MSTPSERPPTTAPQDTEAGCADTVQSEKGVALTTAPEPPPGSAGGALVDGLDHSSLGPVDPSHYVRRGELAHGGMGRIVEARDRRLGRDVAIKELLFDSQGLRARFEREARITARLQHPAIVDIHEAGVWPSGAPFFAMKLVAGRPLDQVIADARTLPERLALLPTVIAVASALAYAHQRRIIHRDLKPANVLVGEFGETVVIDWGLAKDLSVPVGEREPTLPPSLDPAAAGEAATVVGAVMGTPNYMPPEQARGESVDERADVYALGAMLYHLLAGQPPYVGPAQELLARVRAGPPPPLGARTPGVPRDLLSIVEKAMAREPGARYPTARELAHDLTRFQTGQLVGSHHYSRGQLLRRWFSRNARVAGVGGAALVLLLLGGGVSLRRIILERERAEASRAEAEALVEFMVGDLKWKLAPLGKVELLSSAARRAVAYYENRGEALSPAEQNRRALAHANLGQVLMAQGDMERALTEHRTSLAVAQALVAREPSNPDWQGTLSVALAEVGFVLTRQGDIDAALEHLRRAQAVDDQLMLLQPGNVDRARHGWVTRSRIGDALSSRGDLGGAVESYRQGLAFVEVRAQAAPENDDWQYVLSQAHNQLGATLQARGDTTGAIAEYRAALVPGQRLVEKDPSVTTWQSNLGLLRNLLGDALLAQGDLQSAQREYQGAMDIAKALAERDPVNAEWQRQLSVAHTGLGDVLTAQGDLAGAQREYQADLALAEQLAARDPSNSILQRDLSISHVNVGGLLEEQGELPRALAAYRAAAAIRARLLALDPANLDWQLNLSASHGQVGAVLLKQHEVRAALAEFELGLTLAQAVAGHDPKNATWASEAATAHAHLSEALLAQGQAGAALAQAREATAIGDRLVGEHPDDADFQSSLGEAHAHVAAALVATRAPKEARAEYQAAAECFARVLAKDPTNAPARRRAEELRARAESLRGPASKFSR